LRDIFEKGEGNRHSNPENYEKVYFPHTAGIPGGFHPIGQRGRGYSLTYSVVKQAELRSKKPFAESDVIQIKNSELLEIHPLVTLVPLVCAGENPILISMIPGKGHHY